MSPSIRRYILFHGKRHPSQMGKEQIEDYLSHLAVDRSVAAASTQNQALNAILFLYREVLDIERTTMLYTHVLKRGGQGVMSPLDAM